MRILNQNLTDTTPRSLDANMDDSDDDIPSKPVPKKKKLSIGSDDDIVEVDAAPKARAPDKQRATTPNQEGGASIDLRAKTQASDDFKSKLIRLNVDILSSAAQTQDRTCALSTRDANTLNSRK